MNLAGHRVRRLSGNYFEPWGHSELLLWFPYLRSYDNDNNNGNDNDKDNDNDNDNDNDDNNNCYNNDFITVVFQWGVFLPTNN